MKEIRERKSALRVAALLTCLAGAALCGCGGKAEITKQDQNNFQGGPMPAGYAAEAAKRKAEADKNTPASYKAWQDQRNAQLGHGGAPPNAPPIETPANK